MSDPNEIPNPIPPKTASPIDTGALETVMRALLHSQVRTEVLPLVLKAWEALPESQRVELVCALVRPALAELLEQSVRPIDPYNRRERTALERVLEESLRSVWSAAVHRAIDSAEFKAELAAKAAEGAKRALHEKAARW